MTDSTTPNIDAPQMEIESVSTPVAADQRPADTTPAASSDPFAEVFATPLYQAAINCRHSITAERLIVYRSEKSKDVALAQMAQRLGAAASTIHQRLTADLQATLAGREDWIAATIATLQTLQASKVHSDIHARLVEAERLGLTIPLSPPAPTEQIAEQTAAAAQDHSPTDTDIVNWLEQHTLNVRINLRHGSKDLFWTEKTSGEPNGFAPEFSLREQALAFLPPTTSGFEEHLDTRILNWLETMSVMVNANDDETPMNPHSPALTWYSPTDNDGFSTRSPIRSEVASFIQRTR